MLFTKFGMVINFLDRSDHYNFKMAEGRHLKKYKNAVLMDIITSHYW